MNTQLLVLTKHVSPKSWKSVTRCFGTSCPAPPKSKEDTPTPIVEETNDNKIVYKQKVGYWGKRMLVMTGHYKKVEDVPDLVKSSQFEKSSSTTRLVVGIGLTIVSALMLATTVFTARSSAKILGKKED